MPDFRKGLQPEPSRDNGSRNPFPGFVRNIQWTKDREEKYIAFLNPVTEMTEIMHHSFIPVGTWKSGKPRYEEFIARTDPSVGETTDDLTDRLNRRPAKRDIAIAVELEPTYTTVNGRKRPTGFVVKTETFERKKEDGSTEEVEAPVIGPVIQSRRNFYGWVGSFDDSTAEIEKTPLQVIRRGTNQDTAYDFTPFIDQPIDYSNLIDHVENVSYLSGIKDDLDLSGNQSEVALAIGKYYLDRRLTELVDGERYERLVTPIEYIEDKFGGNSDRPARPSQRTAKTEQLELSSEESSGNSKFDELRRMHEAAH